MSRRETRDFHDDQLADDNIFVIVIRAKDEHIPGTELSGLPCEFETLMGSVREEILQRRVAQIQLSPQQRPPHFLAIPLSPTLSRLLNLSVKACAIRSDIALARRASPGDENKQHAVRPGLGRVNNSHNALRARLCTVSFDRKLKKAKAPLINNDQSNNSEGSTR
jgi:hypothetical protein